MAVFWRTQRESFAPLYWTMVVCNFVLPLVLMGIRQFRTITGAVIASIGVVIGMWLERFLIIVPSLGHKYLPYSYGIYRPQPVEIIVAGATFAAMALLYVLFAKVVPIISIWELKAGEHPRRSTRRRRQSARSERHNREGGLRSVSGRAVGAAGGQSPARRRAHRSRHHRHLVAADGGIRVRPDGQVDVDVADRLRRRRHRHVRRAGARVDHRDLVAHQRRRPADRLPGGPT